MISYLRVQYSEAIDAVIHGRRKEGRVMNKEASEIVAEMYKDKKPDIVLKDGSRVYLG